MSKQNWSFVAAVDGAETRQVKVNNEVAAYLVQSGLVVEIIEGYPWICTQLVCPSCRIAECRHGRQRRLRQAALHRFVWRQFCGPYPKRNDKGELLDVHHRNEDKLDARIKNLQLLSRPEHSRLHVQNRRRVTYRHRHDFGGFRFRPHLPAKVKTPANDETLRAMIGTKVVTTAKQRPKTIHDRLRSLEDVLARELPIVAAAMRPTGPHVPIPRSASPREWRTPKTRALGLREYRLGCTAAETCFVLLLILHDLDLDRVAEDLEEPIDVLRLLMKRVPVSVAIERWVKYRRVPYMTDETAKPSPNARTTATRRGPRSRGQGGQ